ncbi:hypothetical protein AB0I54_45155 [Streptomyces sp. NPDC050625]|uniref:hypothetical protein n=1 Tax=Streptomyces sp. NPDC050625 TaxID=3154629 RepID=UPI00342200A7
MSGDGASRRIDDGRWVVSRAWVIQHTGASAATVARWYAQREQYPPERRFPEVACTIEGTHYYVQEAVEAFWAAWREDVGTGRLQTAGRRPGDGRGNQGGGPSRAQRDQAVATALDQLRKAGGYRHGIATQLAREHGGNERGWQRAVAEARTLYEHSQNHDDKHDQEQDYTGPAPQTAKPSP